MIHTRSSFRFFYMFVAIFSVVFVSLAGDLFILGTKNDSDSEFKQSNFNTDFYPDTQSVGDLAKEINTSWYTAQYFHFDVSQSEANQGITFHLDPAWNDGSGTLTTAVDVWTGSAWEEANATIINGADAGYVEIPHGYLKTGTNDVRVRAVSGTGGTSAITWDQIKCQTSSFNEVWRLGNNNASDSEFDQSGFSEDFDVETQSVADFPKEINTSWWPNQYIDFTLTATECEKAKILSFDVHWNDGSGTLKVRLQRWDGNDWDTIGEVDINSQKPGVLYVPVNQLQSGLNEWRLTAVSGTSGTTAVVWDSMALYERNLLPESVQNVLGTVLDTSLNYWLTTNAVHKSGIPLTALKIGDRARYGYSNPTEWGYAMQGWIAASDRDLITAEQCRARLTNVLATLRTLQQDTNEFKYGLFYPFYKLTDGNGNDNSFPTRDADPLLPSGDCALLYGSVHVVEGWGRWKGYTNVWQEAANVKAAMTFTNAYRTVNGGTNAVISHQINATNGVLSAAAWEIYADEGGMVNFIAGPLSGGLTSNQWHKVHDYQVREEHSWNGIATKESAVYSMMFTWAQRTLLGFPFFGNSKERVYGTQSWAPAMRAHLTFGASTNYVYPAFSAAMTQTVDNNAFVGWVQNFFIPPNTQDKAQYSIDHVVPHALFVPAGAMDVLDESVLREFHEKWVLLKADGSGVWHPTGSQDPYGFEVVASKTLNHTNYPGADAGRYIFESLSHGYTTLSIHNGLVRQTNGSGRTWWWYAACVPNYTSQTAEYLNYAYPNQ
jgi:hypothetical protein